MSIITLIAIFTGCLLIVSTASIILTEKLQKLALRLNLSESLLGIAAAIGVNSPNIFSAIFAILMKHHEIGFGVIIGSNIINLAGILGIAAVVSGPIQLGMRGLVLNGGVGFLSTLILTFLILGKIAIWWALLLLTIPLVPYFFFISKQPSDIKRMVIPQVMKRFLTLSIEHLHSSIKKKLATKFSYLDILIAISTLFAILAGCFALVWSAIEISLRWGISEMIVGSLILAGLTLGSEYNRGHSARQKRAGCRGS